MLGKHNLFLAQDNKKSAVDKKNEIMKEIRSLVYMPQRFPFFNEPYIPVNKYHKLFVKK